MEAKIEVSESGEQWSPNTPPPAVAARVAYTSVDNSPPAKLKAMGTEMGIIIAYVPQEVPVEKAIRPDIKNTSTGNIAGVSQDLDTETI